MDITSVAIAEITSVEFLLVVPGVGARRRQISAPTRAKLDKRVRSWLMTLDPDVEVSWPAEYEQAD